MRARRSSTRERASLETLCAELGARALYVEQCGWVRWRDKVLAAVDVAGYGWCRVVFGVDGRAALTRPLPSGATPPTLEFFDFAAGAWQSLE